MSEGGDVRIRPSELEGEPLSEHEGIPITRTAAKIVKTGDGLSESLDMAPIHLPMGAEVFVVIPARVISHEYDFVKEGTPKVEQTDQRIETAVLEASGAFFVDPDLIDDLAKKHAERIAAYRQARQDAKDEAAGKHRLPFAAAAAGDGEDSGGSGSSESGSGED